MSPYNVLVLLDEHPAGDTDEQDAAEQDVIREMIDVRTKEQDLQASLDELNEDHRLRIEPVQRQITELHDHLSQLNSRLDFIRASKCQDGVPPGPACLRWVGGDAFNLVCILVIVSNLVVLVQEVKNPLHVGQYWIYDQLFLGWYVTELLLKIILFQNTFFIGPCTLDRAFQWLDLVIVIAGIADQWATPVLMHFGVIAQGGQQVVAFNPSALRALRMLRVTRMLRVCKVVNLLFRMDMTWADRPFFEGISTFVIFTNSITMGAELDFPWWGWRWVNAVFLAFYTFEMLVKMKRHRCNYFTHDKLATWHLLDFTIVITGLIETAVLPLYHGMEELITGRQADETQGKMLSVIRIFRLARVLRLYRLLTFSKSLRTLVLGVADAMQGTIWVIILTFVVLYIFAIIFTTLVGHGMVVNAPPEAESAFGSVEQSLYMLFKLMNDDQSVVQDLTESVWVRLLFMVSMVVLNWVMLATLTSVISGHMNSSTSRAEKAEVVADENKSRSARLRRLTLLFKEELDIDGNGTIERKEFEKSLLSPFVRKELYETTGLNGSDFAELFDYLSFDSPDNPKSKIIRYEDFIEKLMAQANTATERAIYRLEARLRQNEKHSKERFERLMRVTSVPVDERPAVAAEDRRIHRELEQPEWKDFAKQLAQAEKQEKALHKKSKRLRGNTIEEGDVSDEDLQHARTTPDRGSNSPWREAAK